MSRRSSRHIKIEQVSGSDDSDTDTYFVPQRDSQRRTRASTRVISNPEPELQASLPEIKRPRRSRTAATETAQLPTTTTTTTTTQQQTDDGNIDDSTVKNEDSSSDTTFDVPQPLLGLTSTNIKSNTTNDTPPPHNMPSTISSTRPGIYPKTAIDGDTTNTNDLSLTSASITTKTELPSVPPSISALLSLGSANVNHPAPPPSIANALAISASLATPPSTSIPTTNTATNMPDIRYNNVQDYDLSSIQDLACPPPLTPLTDPADIKNYQYKCHLCEYVTNIKGHFTRHKKTHRRQRFFKCTFCDYSAPLKSTVTTHIRTHTGEKPFKCTRCDYATAHPGALTTHIRTHTGEKPFECEVCDYATKQRHDLTRHMLVHTGDKSYFCTYCEYATTRLDSLNTHLRIHTGDRPYKCTYCDYAATLKSHLNVHLRLHTDPK